MIYTRKVITILVMKESNFVNNYQILLVRIFFIMEKKQIKIFIHIYFQAIEQSRDLLMIQKFIIIKRKNLKFKRSRYKGSHLVILIGLKKFFFDVYYLSYFLIDFIKNNFIFI